jgi:hypothetical protein
MGIRARTSPVINLIRPAERVERFDGGCCTGEQWMIREGKNAIRWTLPGCCLPTSSARWPRPRTPTLAAHDAAREAGRDRTPRPSGELHLRIVPELLDAVEMQDGSVANRFCAVSWTGPAFAL